MVCLGGQGEWTSYKHEDLVLKNRFGESKIDIMRLKGQRVAGLSRADRKPSQTVATTMRYSVSQFV